MLWAEQFETGFFPVVKETDKAGFGTADNFTAMGFDFEVACETRPNVMNGHLFSLWFGYNLDGEGWFYFCFLFKLQYFISIERYF